MPAIPWNRLTYVDFFKVLNTGTDTITGILHLFELNGRQMIVQSEWEEKKVELQDLMAPEYWQDWHRRHDEALMNVANLMHTINPLSTPFAYLVDLPNGSQKLLKRANVIRRAQCQTWAPRIDVHDVEITNYLSTPYRHGTWKGRDVDIVEGWETRTLRNVEKETLAHRALVGLDLSYEVYGHLTRDGEVTGLILEPSEGRCIEYRDKRKVYDAFAKLQRHGIIFRGGLFPSHLQVHDGKVRFAQSLWSIQRLEGEEAKSIDDMAEFWHWRQLRELFQELKACPSNCTPWRVHVQGFRECTPSHAPHRSLRSILCVYQSDFLPLLVDWAQDNKALLKRKKKSGHQQSDKELLEYFEWAHSVIKYHLPHQDHLLPSLPSPPEEKLASTERSKCEPYTTSRQHSSHRRDLEALEFEKIGGPPADEYLSSPPPPYSPPRATAQELSVEKLRTHSFNRSYPRRSHSVTRPKSQSRLLLVRSHEDEDDVDSASVYSGSTFVGDGPY